MNKYILNGICAINIHINRFIYIYPVTHRFHNTIVVNNSCFRNYKKLITIKENKTIAGGEKRRDCVFPDFKCDIRHGKCKRIVELLSRVQLNDVHLSAVTRRQSKYTTASSVTNILWYKPVILLRARDEWGRIDAHLLLHSPTTLLHFHIMQYFAVCSLALLSKLRIFHTGEHRYYCTYCTIEIRNVL